MDRFAGYDICRSGIEEQFNKQKKIDNKEFATLQSELLTPEQYAEAAISFGSLKHP